MPAMRLRVACSALPSALALWERDGVRETRHDIHVFILRGDTDVMPG